MECNDLTILRMVVIDATTPGVPAKIQSRFEGYSMVVALQNLDMECNERLVAKKADYNDCVIVATTRLSHSKR